MVQDHGFPLYLSKLIEKKNKLFRASGNPVLALSSAFTYSLKLITTPDKLLKPCYVILYGRLYKMCTINSTSQLTRGLHTKR